MTIKKKEETERTIDLTGPDGNIYVLLGYASTWGNQMGLDAQKIREEMMSSDYENAVQTFDKYFGSIVTLLR